MTSGIQRRPFALAAVAAAVLGIAAVAYGVSRPPTPGPLQPTGSINSFGLWVDNGATLSFVVELRGEQVLTATLQSVSLANPDPGLTVVSTGILTSPFTGYTSKTFPPGDLKPVAGTVFTTRPNDPAGDVFLVLGIQTHLLSGPGLARGVWLDYDVDGAHHRALLPWLLTVCPTPQVGVCRGQDGSSFEIPAPD